MMANYLVIKGREVEGLGRLQGGWIYLDTSCLIRGDFMLPCLRGMTRESKKKTMIDYQQTNTLRTGCVCNTLVALVDIRWLYRDRYKQSRPAWPGRAPRTEGQSLVADC